MAIRSIDNIKVVEAFEGVNDAVDKLKAPDRFVPFSVGGYSTERSQFERLKGKQLINIATTNPGSILCIKQLDFRDQKIVVYHSSNGYFKGDQDDLTSLIHDVGDVNPVGTLVL
jgi:hypothetical protein